MQVKASKGAVTSSRTLLALSGSLLAGGLVLNFVVTLFHPSREDPNDHAAVFAEYAADGAWKAVHFGQLAAALIAIAGLVILYSALRRDGRASGDLSLLASLALAATVATAPAVAILQAIDGIALKEAVDAWAAAAPADKAATFHDAEVVRWAEWAANSCFRVLSGVAVLLYGLAVAGAAVLPRLLGWAAAIAGALYIAVGVVVGYEGFSDASMLLSAPADLLLLVFGGGIVVTARRRPALGD